MRKVDADLRRGRSDRRRVGRDLRERRC